jgi:hypothetical protein
MMTLRIKTLSTTTSGIMTHNKLTFRIIIISIENLSTK